MAGFLAAPWLAAITLACASGSPPAADDASPPPPAEAEAGKDEAAAVTARRSGVEAAREREQSVRHIEEMELRVGDDFLEEHRVRVTARLPLRHPGEVSAERQMYAADARLAESRLAEAQLTRETESCFPAVESEVRREEQSMFDTYAARQAEFVEHNTAGRQSGMVNEIDATRFELARRVRLLNREPSPSSEAATDLRALPLLVSPVASLSLSETTLRDAVAGHHPSVATHRATAMRYEAMADRARSRGKPWIKFVDVNYLHRSGKKNDGAPNDAARNGGGAKVAFTIPFGGGKADTRHYAALGREQRGEAEARVEDQMLRGRLALETLNAFEARTQQLVDLLELADDAEAVADRWWTSKRGKPSQIAGLVDEAFSARSAVLEAREEAGVARCTLLAMTGVAAEDWPRDSSSAQIVPALVIAPDDATDVADDVPSSPGQVR